MRRNVTIGFSEEEILRLQGAAAMARVPLSTYLRWLIRGKADDTLGQTLSAILARWRRVGLPAREAIVSRLKARGVPSSMIRQVEATLDELDGKNAARRRFREYKRKHGNACAAKTCVRNVIPLYTEVYKESEC